MATPSFADGTQSCMRDVRPPITIHPRSMWGDIFSNFSLDDQVQKEYTEGIEALKKEAGSMLMAATSKKLMVLVDTIERLGLAYHFKTEIQEKLQEIYKEDDADYDLFFTSLRFRLLRQHQYPVSCSVFDKYKDNEGKFQEALIYDVEGLLSLYEAAYVQVNGEGILGEAVVFTTDHLTRMRSKLESPLKDKVNRALQHPFHRDVQIIHARICINIYEKDESRDKLLLKLAKLNFNFLQNLYKKELCELSRWWNKFDLKSKLPYIRDSWVEAYLWGAALNFEPHYSDVRIAAAKCMQLIIVMDDTFDNYATLREAQLLYEILGRWDMDEIDRLPDYMKIVYHFIMSIYEDYDRDAAKEQKFAVPYFKEMVKQLGRALYQEQKWVMERQVPSFKEYVRNSEITSCVYIAVTGVIPFLKSATKEAVDLLLSEPRLTLSVAIIFRFRNDLATHERESKGGEVLTAVDFYMAQQGVSKQQALLNFAQIIEDEWKNMNAASTTITCLPREMVDLLLNYVRMAEATYTHPNYIKEHIKALFVDRLLI